MRVAAVDQGFVVAAPERVFDVLKDPSGYPTWWPGVRATGDGRLVLSGARAVRADPTRARPGVGLFVGLSGRGFDGHIEWYLEPCEGGTVVNCITDLEARRGWRPRRILALRSGVRRAMVALKERLE